MAHIEFGTRERALLLALMALGGTASNVELRERFGDALDGEPRRRLNDLKMVESTLKRSYHHEMLDKGWAWCVDELSATPPPRSGSLGRALYLVLPMIKNNLDHAKIPLGEYARQGRPSPTEDVAADLEARIREAYWDLAAKPQDWVPLTKVRPLLEGADRAEVDSALQRLERRSGVHLAAEENQKTLTAADRAAALRIGGSDKHLLAIEDR